MCIALCTIVAHNIAQNTPDNFPSYPPDNHHCSDDVYLREGGFRVGRRSLFETQPIFARNPNHGSYCLTQSIPSSKLGNEKLFNNRYVPNKNKIFTSFFVIQRDVRLKMLTESSEQYGDKNLNFFAATLYKTSHLSRLNTTHLNPQKVVILRPTPIQSNPCCPLQIRVNALSIKTFAGFGLRWRIQSGYWEQLSHARE